MKTNGNILVVGSLNMDIVTKVSSMPKRGQTILGNETHFVAGGKGNNQAAAAAKLGASVQFIGRIGRDSFGKTLNENLIKEDICNDYVIIDEKNTTGVAIIFVDSVGENSIVLSSGANMAITYNDIDNARERIRSADVVMCQLEIPLDVVKYTLKIAKDNDKMTILDPAPACKEAIDLLPFVDIVTPNETEAHILTDIVIREIDDAIEAASILEKYGSKIVIIKLGEKGVLLYKNGSAEFIKAHEVKAVDSTAAGDTFNGAFAAALVRGESLEMAAEYGNYAATLSVTGFGAQTSIPSREDVEAFISDHS